MARKYGFYITVTVLFCSAVYLLLFSDSGYFTREELYRMKNDIEVQISKLKQENLSLKGIYNDYREGVIPPRDMFHSGLLPGNALAMKYRNLPSPVDTDYDRDSKGVKKSNMLLYMRITWISVSLLTVGLLIYMGFMDARGNDNSDYS